jgi:hypothetical protein
MSNQESNQNPIVQDTAQGTFNEVINSLDYTIAGLIPISDSLDDAQPGQLSAAQIRGLVNHLLSIKQASESGFAQHLQEVKKAANE